MQLPTETATTTSCSELVRLLDKNKYNVVGDGGYATVYAQAKSSTVVKVGRLSYYDGWADDAYLTFLRKMDPTNPMFPVITEITLFNNNDELYYVIRMERLIELELVPDRTRDEVFKSLGIVDIYDFEWVPAWAKGDEWTAPMARPKIKCAFAKKAHALLIRLFKLHNTDVHDGNFMWRMRTGDTPQLVITDPIS